MTDFDRQSIDTNAFNFLLKSDKQVEEFMNDVDGKTIDTEKTPEEILQFGRRTFNERYFSKIEAGSLRGSIFAMSSLALGTGCLALPLQFKNMSLLGALIIVVFSGLSAYWSLTIMISSSVKYKTTDYSKLVFYVFGRSLSMILDITILIYIFGILISYQVISIYILI